MSMKIITAWLAGRSCTHRNEAMHTNGTDLYSYGLLIGTRGIDGKLIAIRPYGVSQQTDLDQRYAMAAADRVTWGIAGKRTSWYEVRTFPTDPALIGTQVVYKVSKSWSRRSTAEKHLAAMQAANTPAYANGTLRVEFDESLDHYAIYFNYLVSAGDLAYSSSIDTSDLIGSINTEVTHA